MGVSNEKLLDSFLWVDPQVGKIPEALANKLESIVDRMDRDVALDDFDGFDFSYRLGWTVALITTHFNFSKATIKEQLLERIHDIVSSWLSCKR